MIYLTRKQYKDYLIQIKNRIGRRTFPKEVVKELIELGFVAGDHSRLYLTDKGEDLVQEKVCTACNGTGYYDDNGGPYCYICEGKGIV